MNFKITKQALAKPKRIYPYLGIFGREENSIVLFTSPETGTELQTGDFQTDWTEDAYTIFTGSITLSN